MRKTWDDVQLNFTDNGKENWNIKDSDGCGYENLEQFITTGVLGFCDCGSPEAALAYIKTGLELINYPCPEDIDPKEGWRIWYAAHRERCYAHFKSQGAEYLFYYFCDFHGLTEHGGSVPGWLTDKGKKLLELIEKCKNIETNVLPNI
jgi:hypothetical protein